MEEKQQYCTDAQGRHRGLLRNPSGYIDPTAYQAIKNVDGDTEVTAESWRFHELLDTLRAVCELADFEIGNRIVLIDKRTGKVWK